MNGNPRVQVLIKSLQDCMATIEDDYNSRYLWEKGKGERGWGRKGGEEREEEGGREGESCCILTSPVSSAR